MASSPPPATWASASASPTPTAPRSRQLYQLGLFFTGASFLAASVLVSRRSVIRQRLGTMPAFHTSNRHAAAPDSADRFSLAIRALGLATLNVSSFAVLLVGGIAWGFDLCSVAELRARTRAALQRPSTTAQDHQAERELEETIRPFLEKLGFDTSPSPTNVAGEQEKK
ncbi:hypothetical protein CDD82_5285 [Ophiocordyceps australis]|uniref:Altered inheritance of mitochondria protein 11 n=1 Tax=Ophiocordyceps australis TaxID=1399860 RepID=A0A2C5Y448_9HYPO|nr:hypothetical protein CDD82_5285 [Ophiocordyceps australis]